MAGLHRDTVRCEKGNKGYSFNQPPLFVGGDSEQEFDIEKNSGSIVIARPLNAGRRSNYNLTVRATDGTKAIKTQVTYHRKT